MLADQQPAPAEACTHLGADPVHKEPGVLIWALMGLGFVVFFAIGSVLILWPESRSKPVTRTFGDYKLLRRLQMGPLAAMRMARRMSKPRQGGGS